MGTGEAHGDALARAAWCPVALRWRRAVGPSNGLDADACRSPVALPPAVRRLYFDRADGKHLRMLEAPIALR